MKNPVLSAVAGPPWQSEPYGRCGPTALLTNSYWSQYSTNDYDWGAIKLNCSVGNSTGTLGLYVNANNSYFQNRSELLAAYHLDKPWGTMWLGPGNITSVEVRRFFYTNDTATGGGNSGAPVYSWHTQTSNWQADTIHTLRIWR
jgi:glutamyl endopeptidase